MDTTCDSNGNEAVLRLSPSAAIKLYRMLGNGMDDIRVKDISVSDDGFDHDLEVHLCTDNGNNGTNSRLQNLVAQFS